MSSPVSDGADIIAKMPAVWEQLCMEQGIPYKSGYMRLLKVLSGCRRGPRYWQEYFGQDPLHSRTEAKHRWAEHLVSEELVCESACR